MRIQREQGITLVELLIASAIGLFIVAIATTLLVGQIKEHRAVLMQARLMQDLRVAADIVARDLRRAGYWGDAGASVVRSNPSPGLSNPYTALAPASSASDAVSFRYSRDDHENHAVDANERFGFRLRSGVIEMSLGTANWQALTDSNTMIVTAFSISPSLQEIPLQTFCVRTCSSGTEHCEPKQVVRSLAVTISGRSATDRTVTRTVRAHVRLRNDAIVGACEA